MDRYQWLKSWLRFQLHKGRNNIGEVVAAKPVMKIEVANDFIYERIYGGAPLMVCRFGSTELRLISDVEAVQIGLKRKTNQKKWDDLNQYSGFFPNDIQYSRQFAELYFNMIPEADLIAIWNNPHEDYMIQKYAKNTSVTVLRALEPWYTSGRPWTYALKGKKVLVIHPFAETIMSQYQKRELLFENDQILPEFELHTLKAVQTLADETDERFTTWFEALEWMYQESKKTDFDIAILGDRKSVV